MTSAALISTHAVSPAFTAAEVAASAHVKGRDFAKTVIVKIEGGLAMVVLPATRRIVLHDLRELLEEEERTRLARNEAAALDERSRIARELHDVLAHSLSALSVELEGARLLALDRDVDSEVIAAIGRAHRHAAAGLDDERPEVDVGREDVGAPGDD